MNELVAGGNTKELHQSSKDQHGQAVKLLLLDQLLVLQRCMARPSAGTRAASLSRQPVMSEMCLTAQRSSVVKGICGQQRHPSCQCMSAPADRRLLHEQTAASNHLGLIRAKSASKVLQAA